MADTLHFRLREGASVLGNLDFRLFDAQGNLLLEKQLPGAEAFSISRQGTWPSGHYFYEMSKDGERVQSGKVVLK